MNTCYQHVIGNAVPTIMVIITDYSLEFKVESDVFYVRSHETSYCPYCNNKLKVSGSRRRVLYKDDGSKVYLIIRRLYCDKCERTHHELPDIIVPYKRYESEVIEAILCGNEDYPCEETTATRIKLWFFFLREYFEGALVAIAKLYHQTAPLSLPLHPLARQPAGWLKRIVQNLVNTSRWQQTRSA